jgi:hypothetical protein
MQKSVREYNKIRIGRVVLPQSRIVLCAVKVKYTCNTQHAFNYESTYYNYGKQTWALKTSHLDVWNTQFYPEKCLEELK